MLDVVMHFIWIAVLVVRVLNPVFFFSDLVPVTVSTGSGNGRATAGYFWKIEMR